MTQASSDDFSARAASRLRAHWGAADVQITDGPHPSERPEAVRVRVSEQVSLEASCPEQLWTVRAILDEQRQPVPDEPDRTYGIGLNADASPEDFADRFYEEIRFWWAELHPAPGAP